MLKTGDLQQEKEVELHQQMKEGWPKGIRAGSRRKAWLRMALPGQERKEHSSVASQLTRTVVGANGNSTELTIWRRWRNPR